MFCTQCGTEAAGNHRYCGSCGSRLDSKTSIALRPEFSEPLRAPELLSSVSELPAPNLHQPANQVKGAVGLEFDYPTRFRDVIAFCYRNYAEFDGRATRTEFWKWYLYVVTVPLGTICLIVLLSNVIPELLGLLPISLLVFSVTHLIPTLACGVRRLHDTGRPGYGICVALIPIVGNLLLLFWLVQRSRQVVTADEPLHFDDQMKSSDTESWPISSTAGEVDPVPNSRDDTLRLIAYAGLCFAAVFVAGFYFSVFQAMKLVDRIESSEVRLGLYYQEQQELKNQIDETFGTTVLGLGLTEYQTKSGTLASLNLPHVAFHYEEIDNVIIPFWDARTRKIRTLYLAHNKAWQGQIRERVSNANSSEFAIEIRETWDAFCGQIEDAKSLTAIGSISNRLDDLCD
jgi:uncharacterized membrane protein YhaH (DUF805 family)